MQSRTDGIRSGPRRIVCLTEETTEILYLLGEQDRIVGISAYTVRPPEARRDKPVVSAFIDGSVAKIKALEPDLVIGFSDVQAGLAADIIKAHLPILVTSQRSIEEIFDVITLIGRIVCAEGRALGLVRSYQERLDAARARAQARRLRPRVYFEEWQEPRICGSRWISELITYVGGVDIFADKAKAPAARDRQVTDGDIISAEPEIILASWCGKPVSLDAIRTRPGYDTTPAIKRQQVYEIDSSLILQPGPASLSDGLDIIEKLVEKHVERACAAVSG